MEEQLITILSQSPTVAVLAYALYLSNKRHGECMSVLVEIVEKVVDIIGEKVD